MISLQRPHKLLLCCTVLASLSWAASRSGADVATTKHNLSALGPGQIKVAGETEMCKFCHTPHASNPIAPLWNRHDPGTYYETYESSTLKAAVGQPTGSSRLCLSCHDGTIALTQTYNPQNAPPGTIYITSQDRGYLGTHLGDDHPISFAYDSALAAQNHELLDPASLPASVSLDNTGQLQCATCHDPHDNTFGKFLTMSNVESQMCRTCHATQNWASSSHATSTASLAGAQQDTWDNIDAATVRQAACEACHRPHSAGGQHRLLRREAEEDNCLSCHDGTVAAKNVAAEMNKISAHPVTDTTGVHDPAEDPSTMAEHVECADCHNPHQASSGAATNAPFLKPGMKGAKGVSGAGAVIEAVYEYQVCYKCHAGSGLVSAPFVDRVHINADTAAEFAPANPSYHPVETQGKNNDVPSLLQPYTTGSIIIALTATHRTHPPPAPAGRTAPRTGRCSFATTKQQPERRKARPHTRYVTAATAARAC